MRQRSDPRQIPVGSGFKEVVWVGSRPLLVVLLFFFLIFMIPCIIFVILALITGDPGYLFDAITIFFGITSFLMLLGLILGIAFSIAMVLVWKLVKGGNTIFLGEDVIKVNSQAWSTMPIIPNEIPISLISDIKKADKAYWKDRWKRTKLWWKVNRMYPLPPKGGLHPMFSTRSNLLIIFMKVPLLVHSQKLDAIHRMGMTVEEHWVQEVVIDVHPDHQDDFINRIRRSKRVN